MMMENRNGNDGFQYTYSAQEQEEIKKIRQKYQPKEMDKMEKLRKLDAGATNKATAYAVGIGVVGALVMGSGMSLVMTNIGDFLGMQEKVVIIFGILLGMIGMVLIGAAYPMYCKVIKREREKIAPEILRISDELMR